MGDIIAYNPSGRSITFNEEKHRYTDDQGIIYRSCTKIIHELFPPQPKSLNEARGIITADYQNYLEKQWIEELRARYDVLVNEDVLKSIE